MYGFTTEFVDAIMPLKHLEKLDIRFFLFIDGANIELTKFLDNFNQVKDIKFPLLNMNSYYFQKKYPHIRFRWYGEKEFDNEDEIYYEIYEGEFNEDSEFEGKGVLYSKISKYDGEWKNGKKNGKHGVIKFYFSGTTIKYEGGWVDNCMEGIGITYYPDGSIQYKGEYKRNDMSGRGIYYYKNGDRYEGDFISNVKHNGNYFHSDGGRYEGQWVNNVRKCTNGEVGIYHFPNGSKYVGEFQSDEFDGNGIYYYSNGSRFEGKWKKGERKEGSYYYADGRCYYLSKYEGIWNEEGSICEKEWEYLKKNDD